MSDSSTDDAGVPADNTASAPADTGGNPAADVTPVASTGADVEQPPSLIDAITKGAEPKQAADPSTAKPEVKDPAKPADQQAKPGEPPLPFAKHPAWQRQLAERRAVEAKATKLDSQVKELAPRAENWTKLEGYVSQAGITGQQFDAGLQIMSLWNSKPEECLTQLRRQVAYLEQQLGETLPADLKAAVDSGEITEERARELSRTKAKATRLETSVKDRDEQERQGAAQEAQAKRVERFRVGLNEAEKKMRARDPDWKAKEKQIVKELKLLILERKPKTPEEANALLVEAHREVTQTMTEWRPKPGNLRELPVGGKSATPTPQHATLMDVINANA